MGFNGFSNLLIWAGLLVGWSMRWVEYMLMVSEKKNKTGRKKSKTRNHYQIKEASSANTNSFSRSLAALEKQLPPENER